MRLDIALGTRPEIIKMAPIIRACQESGVRFRLLHTGQHYSYELDGIFFDELGLPAPDVQFAVGSGSHAYQISTILARLEPHLTEDRPDMILVEGDTNSVLGVALGARTMGIPVGHIEAGLRSGDRTMPEELNRTVVDQIADVCFAPTPRAADNLLRENIAPERIVITGNTIVDEVLHQRPRAMALGMPGLFDVLGGQYIVATVHRAENTNDPDRLRSILEGIALAGRVLDIPVLAALHPRTQHKLQSHHLKVDPAIRVLPPLGYLEFLGLQAQASLVMTDSGGLQEEACSLGIPCVTLRDSTERPESVDVGANILAGHEPSAIVQAARQMIGPREPWPNPFGDGKAGRRTVDWLLEQSRTPARTRSAVIPVEVASGDAGRLVTAV